MGKKAEIRKRQRRRLARQIKDVRSIAEGQNKQEALKSLLRIAENYKKY